MRAYFDFAQSAIVGAGCIMLTLLNCTFNALIFHDRVLLSKKVQYSFFQTKDFMH
jgi:hypothetical protein